MDQLTGLIYNRKPIARTPLQRKSFANFCGRIDMDYKKLSKNLKDAKWTNAGMTDDQSLEWDASDAITDLLARAETAEERCKELEARCKRLDEARERANEATSKWEGMYRMALDRAEKAETEIERLKNIMSNEGIVVIPSKYPGCKSEWNMPLRWIKEE